MTTRDVVVHLCGRRPGAGMMLDVMGAPAGLPSCIVVGCVVLRVPEGERVEACPNYMAHLRAGTTYDIDTGNCYLVDGPDRFGTLYGVTLTPVVLAAIRAMCPIVPWNTLEPRGSLRRAIDSFTTSTPEQQAETVAMLTSDGKVLVRWDAPAFTPEPWRAEED